MVGRTGLLSVSTSLRLKLDTMKVTGNFYSSLGAPGVHDLVGQWCQRRPEENHRPKLAVCRFLPLTIIVDRRKRYKAESVTNEDRTWDGLVA